MQEDSWPEYHWLKDLLSDEKPDNYKNTVKNISVEFNGCIKFIMGQKIDDWVVFF